MDTSYDSLELYHSYTLDCNSYFDEFETEKETLVFLPKPKIQFFKKGELIGVGAFGSVFQAFNLETGGLFAVKEIHFDCFPSALLEQKIHSIEKEVALLQKLKHPNIVTYFGLEREEFHLNIFMELCPGGSLRTLIKKFGTLSENLIKRYIKQVLFALEYLHQHNVVHGDIKCDNILIDLQSNVKLADFGASRQILESGSCMRPIVGTPNFMSPEVVKQEDSGIASDIWSLGCSMIEMFDGTPPYSELRSCASILYTIASSKETPKIPDELSENAINFLKLCFVRDPKSRATAKELLNHQWIKE